MALGLISLTGLAQADDDVSPPQSFSKADMLADLDYAWATYETYHAGLDRYRPQAEVKAEWDAAAADLPEEVSLEKAFLTLSKAAAAVQCGHTYANFYNQSNAVQGVLFDRSDKLPLAFKMVGSEALITADVSGLEPSLKGHTIKSINGLLFEDLAAELTAYVKGDGNRPAVKLHDLTLTGQGKYEPFDIFQPLLAGPIDGAYKLTVETAEGELETVTVPAISRSDRLAKLPTEDAKPWRLEIDGSTAVMSLDTFATWQFDFDWQDWYATSFESLNEAGVDHLIIDIRRNSGGMDSAAGALLGHIATTSLAIPFQKEVLLFDYIAEDQRGGLNTWDPTFYDWRDRVTATGDGRFQRTAGNVAPLEIAANPNAFQGQVTLLIGPTNSSATFTLAKVLKASGRATLLGEETGGAQRGITGGAYFFLQLPNTGLEVDVPLIGYFPQDWDTQPDAGVQPDILIAPSLADVRAGLDPVIERAREMYDLH
ncbi:MAG: S41 family peptidase [Pseudomonadota bacterium]